MTNISLSDNQEKHDFKGNWFNDNQKYDEKYIINKKKMELWYNTMLECNKRLLKAKNIIEMRG